MNTQKKLKSGRGLLWGTIPSFSWRDRGKPRWMR